MSWADWLPSPVTPRFRVTRGESGYRVEQRVLRIVKGQETESWRPVLYAYFRDLAKRQERMCQAAAATLETLWERDDP